MSSAGRGAVLVFLFGLLYQTGPAVAQSAFQVKEINPSGSSLPRDLEPVNRALFEPSTLFFVADDEAAGTEVWRSDGTETGTFRLKDIVPGPTGSAPGELTRVSGSLFAPGRLFFRAVEPATGRELWKSDGTEAGTVLVKDIRPGTASSVPSNLAAAPGSLFSAGTLYFAADDGVNGTELWKSDGTAAGTVMVKDISLGPTSSFPGRMLAIGQTLYFTAETQAFGHELWKSNGTAAGTVLVKDINPGANGSNPANLVNLGGVLLFTAASTGTGGELWRSDGTSAGTLLVKDIRPGSQSSSPSKLVAWGDTVFFTADDGTHGRELWSTTGNAGGTLLVKDLNPGTAAAFENVVGVRELHLVGSTLFLRATNGATGYELWKSDGSAAGTVLVRDINPGPGSSGLGEFASLGSVLFFRASDPDHGLEPWRSDARPGGTFLVHDVVAGPVGSAPEWVTAVYPYVFFSAVTGRTGRELWATDLIFKAGFE